MTIRVPFVSEESIESDANALLSQFARDRHTEIRAPIPIEDIVEKHLKLQVEFDDLHRLFGLTRGCGAGHLRRNLAGDSRDRHRRKSRSRRISVDGRTVSIHSST
jgi:hypothetical protein